MDFIECSALTGHNVNKLFETVVMIALTTNYYPKTKWNQAGLNAPGSLADNIGISESEESVDVKLEKDGKFKAASKLAACLSGRDRKRQEQLTTMQREQLEEDLMHYQRSQSISPQVDSLLLSNGRTSSYHGKKLLTGSLSSGSNSTCST